MSQVALGDVRAAPDGLRSAYATAGKLIDYMNPLRWAPAQRITLLLSAIFGGLIGLAAAWFSSPWYAMTRTHLSGDFSNPAQVLIAWLPYVSSYWPYPAFGGVMGGFAFYLYRLWRLN